MRGGLVKPGFRQCASSRLQSSGRIVRQRNDQVVICVTLTGSHPGRFSVPLHLGNHMPYSSKRIFAFGLLCAAALGSAACSPRKAPPMTVDDLMEDRVTLDGVLLKCNENPAKSRTNTDCVNARIAIERLAEKDVDPAVEAKRKAEFERSREQLRLAQEKARQEQEAKTKVDAYNLPVVPVDPTPKGDAPASAATPTP
ncbi:MAG: EexN family lipoprotein [Steroidobacteraceae bacterium]